ncbi:MAG: transketolase [Patescibacteria group bacterium]
MNNSIDQLQQISKQVRINIINMLTKAGSGHTAGPLGLADIMTAFYFEILEAEDKLILSCGHYVPVRYAVMAEKGIIPKEELLTLRKLGSRLQGHPDRRFLRQLETTSGPLGCGLAQSAGIALAARLDKKQDYIYCITSDGEHNEGNHWEAVMFAAKYKLNHLIQIVDKNNIQIDGTTDEVMPTNPLTEKYATFNWNVIEIDGNDFSQILKSIEKARQENDRPTVIVANTIPGKGVSFMENRWQWHGKVPNKDEAERALKELENAK